MKLLRSVSKKTLVIIVLSGIVIIAVLTGAFFLIREWNTEYDSFENEQIYSFDLGTTDISVISSNLEDGQATLEAIYEQIDASRENSTRISAYRSTKK